MISEPPIAPLPIKLGSCGEPCNDCDKTCDERHDGGRESLWKRFLRDSLFNTLDVCFDDVYQEPKKILIIGGCRQRDLAQHIALLLPAAEIFVVDPDETETQKAKEEICCRFKFVTAPLEALPFETEVFDLTIAHNVMEYTGRWDKAISEISRVTGKNLFLSIHRPMVWSLLKNISGFARGMKALGIEQPRKAPAKFEFLTHLRLYAKIKTMLMPFPWVAYMTEMRPMREEKLVLAS